MLSNEGAMSNVRLAHKKYQLFDWTKVADPTTIPVELANDRNRGDGRTGLGGTEDWT